MKKFFGKNKKTAVILLCCILLFGCFSACTGNRVKIKIGTGSEQGSYYSYATNLAMITKDDADMKVMATAGSAANVRLLQKGFVDAAIVQNDILYSASEGSGIFDDSDFETPLNFSAVSGLYTECIQVVVLKDSDINSIDDLAGKKVSVGEAESGVIQNAEQILNLYGITFQDIESYNLSFELSSDALKNEEIDAFFITAGAPTQAINDLAKEMPIRILSFSDSEIERIRNRYPFYFSVTIPAETYEGMKEDVQTIGVRAVLVVSNKMKKETVKSLTEKVLMYSSELTSYSVTDEVFVVSDVRDAVSFIPIAFHPGAVEYYNSQGLSVEENEEINGVFVFGSQDE